ncbi:hypothetical protein AL486_03595 [Pandoraea apista]|uniref:hypothetical protein n=1 Tax=Pandoraea apista TaxID=93218 RepID=UPI000CE93FCD|nr:hypothetical protein [Pandoraea apista]AVF38907.1 hypothetical protein AL486_03595 [Pandoraea apista]
MAALDGDMFAVSTQLRVGSKPLRRHAGHRVADDRQARPARRVGHAKAIGQKPSVAGVDEAIISIRSFPVNDIRITLSGNQKETPPPADREGVRIRI